MSYSSLLVITGQGLPGNREVQKTWSPGEMHGGLAKLHQAHPTPRLHSLLWLFYLNWNILAKTQVSATERQREEQTAAAKAEVRHLMVWVWKHTDQV